MIATDRWTCPVCNHTEHLQVVTSVNRAHARLKRVQLDHARVHAQRRERAPAPGSHSPAGARAAKRGAA